MYRTSRDGIYHLRPGEQALLLLPGWQCPYSTEETQSSGGRLKQDASGRGWCAALGFVTTRSLNSWKEAWTLLVRFQEQSGSNSSGSSGSRIFSSAHRPLFLDNRTLTSARFSMATVTRAANRSFTQVLFRYMM